MFLYLRDGDLYYVQLYGHPPKVFRDPLELADWVESINPDSNLAKRHAALLRTWAGLPVLVPSQAAAPSIQETSPGSRRVRPSDLPSQEMRDSLMMFCTGFAMPVLDDGDLGCFVHDYVQWAYAYAQGLRDVQRMRGQADGS